MSASLWSRPARNLLAAFLAVTMLPGAALLWLGWRWLEQDRVLETQRARQRSEQAADLLVAALQQRLAAIETSLTNPGFTPSHDAVLLLLEGRRIQTRPPNRLLYQPFAPPAAEPAAQLFAAGEELEYRQKDYPRALAAFRELSRSPDASIRAAAHLRAARTFRKSGRPEFALEQYEALARCDSVTLDGVPAPLIAQRARFTLLRDLNRPSDSRRESEALTRDLSSGRWPMDRLTFLHLAAEAGFEPSPDALAVSSAAEWWWNRRSETPSGRASFPIEGRSWTAVWTPNAALLASPEYIQQAWLQPLAPLLKSQSVSLTLNGQATGVIERAASLTGLPWTLHVTDAEPGSLLRQAAMRRNLLLSVGALLAALFVTGSYLTARALNRELAVARLQSDFVSAVSHEFRTPLTLLRQTTEAFSDGRVASEADRAAFFQAQARATERLHRLVESLLDFGRMEAGAKPYRLQPLDPGTLVRAITSEFQSEMASSGAVIDVRTEPTPAVEADPDAITHALWNLLDNAVKYSPGNHQIEVTVAAQNGGAAIAVRDHGIGIATHEQKQVFRKFFRGGGAVTKGIKGAGIGLAMVSHIVQAHRGRILLESAPGEGSTFTIVLPAAAVSGELTCHASS